MRAALLLICLFVSVQDENFKILQDPARRAKESRFEVVQAHAAPPADV